MTWKKGDILEGTDRSRGAAEHYIVFLEPRDKRYFIGAMLTTSAKYRDNALMSGECFEQITDDGTKYKIVFNNSHVVRGRFLKLENWGPFTKVGQLTKYGVKFVDSETSLTEPEYWDEYESRTRE